MPLYRYTGFDQKGIKRAGVIDADNMEEAKSSLLNRSFLLSSLEILISQKKLTLSKKDLISFFEEISNLLTANLTLYEALSILKEKYENQKFYPLLMDLCDQIRLGKNFSFALSRYPDIFDFIYCSMIANGEKTATLLSAIDEIIKIMKRSENLKKKVVDALLYPALLSIFCSLVIFTLIFFVIPSLSDLFEGKNLHPLTKIVVGLSRFANAYKEYLFVFFLLLGMIVASSFYFKGLKKWFYKIILWVPLFESLISKMALVRFCRSFSVLLGTGIPYVEALKLAREVTRHPLLEEDIASAERRVIEGEKLSSAFRERGNFPILVIRMLEIAEESAKMVEILNHIAEIYENELERSLNKITKILQPLLLVILGAIVGIVVLSVLLPMTDVSSFVN